MADMNLNAEWAHRRVGWSRSIGDGLQLPWDQALIQERSDGWWVKAGTIKVQDRLQAPEFSVVIDFRVAEGTPPQAIKRPYAHSVLREALDYLAALSGGSLDALVRPHGEGWIVLVTGSPAAELNGATP